MNGFSFTANELFELTADVLKCKSPVDRLFIEGMEIKRADIIPAGLLILSEVFSTFKLDEIAKAFAHQASQKHFGKIVLTV